MLAITRFPGERTNLYFATPDGPRLIGTLTLVGCGPEKAKIGFEFPQSVLIVRDEIDQFKERLNEAMVMPKARDGK